MLHASFIQLCSESYSTKWLGFKIIPIALGAYCTPVWPILGNLLETGQ